MSLTQIVKFMKHTLMLLLAVNAVVFSSSAQINGPSTVCTGNSITLTDVNQSNPDNPVPGFFWSADPTIAIVGSATGIVTGVQAGSTIINFSYNVGPTETPSVDVFPITVVANINKVLALPAVSVLVNSTVTLVDAPASSQGTWSSSNKNVATIDQQGKVTGVSAGFSIITFTIGQCSAFTTAVVPPPANSYYVSTGQANQDIHNWHTLLKNDQNLYPDVNKNRTAFIVPAVTLDSIINGMHCTNVVFYLGMNYFTHEISLYYDGAWQTSASNFVELPLMDANKIGVFFDNGLPCPVCGSAGDIHLNSPITPGSMPKQYINAYMYNQDELLNIAGTIKPVGSVLVPYYSDETFTYSAKQGWFLDTLVIDNTILAGSLQNPITENAQSKTFSKVARPHQIGVCFDPMLFGSCTGCTSPQSQVVVPYKSTYTYTITPSDPTSTISSLIVDNVPVDLSTLPQPDPNTGAVTYTITNFTRPHSISAIFGSNQGSSRYKRNKK